MKQCTLCEKAFNFNPGLKGKNADITKLLFVLHRSDTRTFEYFENYWGAFVNSATGVILDRMLKKADLDLPDIYITNLFKCLLPKNSRPSSEQYQNCLKIFEQQVRTFEPRAMVVFGNMSYKYIFQGKYSKHKITDVSGQVLSYNGIPCLVSIHPSQIWKKINPELQEPYIRKIAKFLKANKQ